MSGEGMTTHLPSSLSGSEGNAGTPNPEALAAATAKLDVAITAFMAAGNEFLAAGGDQMELFRKFQAAMGVG